MWKTVVFGAASLTILLSGPVATQERVKAKPGQSCAGYYKGCADWCATNNPLNAQACNATCTSNMDACKVRGEWPLERGTKIVYGLPVNPGAK